MADQLAKRVTAQDVAQAAGVSRTTVSYVLNGRLDSIPSDTQRRVLRAAAELGYEPSAAARMLATGRSDIVLGLLPDWPAGYNFAQLLRQLTESFAARGLVYLSHTEMGRSGDLSPLWLKVSPDAVVVFEGAGQDELDKIKAAGIRVVIALFTKSASAPGQIELWDQHIGRLQAEHLAAAGHRRLGYAWPADLRVRVFAEPRLAGVRAGCREQRLDPPTVHTVPLDPEGAAQAIIAWRSSRPPITAVCAYNDEVAVALLDGLRQLGLSAPADLAIIGVDDMPFSAFTDPPLTTVNYNMDGVAGYLATVVADAIAGRPTAERPDFPAFVWLIPRKTA